MSNRRERERELLARDVDVDRTGGSWGSVEGLNVALDHGVTILFASLNEDGTGLGVWGVEIDGHTYREPRDLTPEPLKEGPMHDLLTKAVELAGGPRTESAHA